MLALICNRSWPASVSNLAYARTSCRRSERRFNPSHGMRWRRSDLASDGLVQLVLLLPETGLQLGFVAAPDGRDEVGVVIGPWPHARAVEATRSVPGQGRGQQRAIARHQNHLRSEGAGAAFAFDINAADVAKRSKVGLEHGRQIEILIGYMQR